MVKFLAELGYRGFFSEVTVTCDRWEQPIYSSRRLQPLTIRVGMCTGKINRVRDPGETGRSVQWEALQARRIASRLRGCHVALDCVFKQFRVCFDVQRLHHPVLVKCDCARFYVDNIRHFFHRHSFRQ